MKEDCANVPTLTPQTNESSEETGFVFWRRPTPQEVALATVDSFLRDHVFTVKEVETIRRYYGNKRVWAVRHLRLTEAERRIRSLIGQPKIILNGAKAGEAISAVYRRESVATGGIAQPEAPNLSVQDSICDQVSQQHDI